jgi:hypothetical protein
MFAAIATLLLQPGACTVETAATTTVEAVAVDPERWIDRCITVAGAASWHMLYADVASIYRTGRLPNGNAGASQRFRIGLDDRHVSELRDWRGSIHPVTVTGRVDTCGRRAQRAESAARARNQPAVFTLSGYCHWLSGAVLIAERVERTGPPVERLMGAMLPRGSGELVEAPPTWRDRDALEEVADAFAAALRSDEAGPLANLLSVRPGTPHADHLLRQSRAAFRQLPHIPRTQLLHFISRYDPGQGLADNGSFEALTCFCRTADCSRLWPRSIMDADAAPERPYACYRVERGDWPGAVPQVSYSTSALLKEPQATALAR